MARWAPEKKDQLESLADEILHNYSHGRAMVAVDGRHGAGQQEFADGLAEALRRDGAHVFRASMDDFFRPRADRERSGAQDGAAYYRDAYDYSLLRRVLIDPFHTSGSTGFVLTGFDVVRDQPVFQPKWMSAGPDAILVMDGTFLLRPDLAGVWNYSVWLSTPLQSGDEDLEIRRAASDEVYLKDANPSEKANTIIDNQDPDHPRRVFADSC
ncbi:uridine kinase [Cryobacterium mesophilum]|uniref:Uridine kinase n=1 Tax=Terrimesophilobacter mesophilus TaxID=433647 RepID=A0A4R8V9E6_9MICO|nr:uridine kinase [Terrimesophilobacter mesophilus]MBB5634070.1 uridine kinase [Terrimesophilobacter mesophilus]TFB78660.1 uridine kinase [Terrimesophilobacter mesophilus]